VNTFNTSSPWVPYKIPPTPIPESGKTYALSFSDNAVPAKNPSQFLQWKEVGLPDGTNKGDIIYWDPNSGEDGEWVVLSAPSSDSLRVLTIKNNTLAWTETEECD
jgi:hypothetical protein